MKRDGIRSFGEEEGQKSCQSRLKNYVSTLQKLKFKLSKGTEDRKTSIFGKINTFLLFYVI